MSTVKQKTTSFLPKYEEWHVPGYNFNGMYTQIPERFGLKYKDKIGTGSYFLPANKLDRVAMQHDLYYYSPHQVSKAYADYKYLTSFGVHVNPSKLLSETVIFGQLLRRVLQSPLEVSLVTGMRVEKIKKLLDKEAWIKGFKRLITTPPVRGYGSVGGYLFNPRSGLASPTVKAFFKKYFGISGTTPGSSHQYRKLFLTKILPMCVVHGLGLVTKPIEDLVESWEFIKSHFEESKEWKTLKKANEKVMGKYDKYLETVGKYDSDENFVIKDDINAKKATREYIKFFKEYRNYIKHINERYDIHEKLPTLNEENIKMVSFPDMQKPPVIHLSQGTSKKLDKLKEKMNSSQIWTDPDKLLKEYKNITKVLTDVKTPSQSYPEIEPKKYTFTAMDDEDIEKVLEGSQPTPTQSYPEIEPKKYTFTEVEDDESI